MIAAMNWTQMLRDLRVVMTLDEIAKSVGLASKGAVHNIVSGKQRSVSYEVGVKLVALHRSKTRAIEKARLAAKPKEITNG